MPFTIKYNPDLHIIEIEHKGTLTLDDLKEIFIQGIQLAKEKECFLFLVDYSKSSIKLTTMEIYDIPKILSNITSSSGIDASRLKRAFIASPEYSEDASFAENVISNVGQNSKFFHDIDKAKKWLIENDNIQ